MTTPFLVNSFFNTFIHYDNLKFEGEYNSGPKNYYGPRYYVKGKLYYETGQLWYEGSFKVEHVGSIRWPLVKFPNCFYEGIEYNKNGDIIKVYTDNCYDF